MSDKSKKATTTRWWIAGGLVLASIIVVSFWFSQSDTPQEPSRLSVEERSVSVHAVDADRAADAVPTDDAPSPQAIADYQPDADTLTRLQQAIRDYLDLPAGRISRLDAWTNLEFLRKHRDVVRGTVAQLVNSDDEHVRLLGMFLHLELYDDIAGLLDQAKRDPSPYIRAEAAGWLYEQGRFDELQAYVENVSRNLTDQERESVRSLMNENPPNFDVPAGLAALQLGQSLPLLYRELARHDQNTRAELLAIISAADMRIDQLSRNLEMLAFLQPVNQRQILAESANNADHLGLARYALVRQIAACGSENDSDHTGLVRQCLPSPPNRHELAPVPFREFYVEQVAKSERAILEARDEQARQRLLTAGTIRQYREALLMTPGRAPSQDALAVIGSIEIPHMYREQRQIVADILFIDWFESL